MSTKFSARIRFNWGFHDGAYAEEINRARDLSGHFDTVYADGYRRGVDTVRMTGAHPESSEAAWREREADAAARRAIRAMRPDSRTVRI